MAFVQPTALPLRLRAATLKTSSTSVHHHAVRSRILLPRMGLLDALKNAITPSKSTTAAPDDDDEQQIIQLETTETESIPLEYTRILTAVNTLEQSIEKKSDAELRSQFISLRSSTSPLSISEEIKTEVYALVREATFRVLELRPYDVQILGALALNDGNIAEMATGEGKTLVAVFPAVLNALPLDSSPVFVVTVNDYLARRDAQLLAPLYKFCGLSVGLIQADMKPEKRREMYACDVVYVTNSELGFDYLRDNLAMSQEDIVLHNKFGYCIVDEADSIMIDEARTPLIISSRIDADSLKYATAKRAADMLAKDTHYSVNEKEQSILLLEQGYIDLEKALKVKDLFDPRNPWAAYITNSIKAKELFTKDVNYIVQDEGVQIVDEFTGRVMKGRRWSDGLHQAVEAKENLKVASEAVVSAKVSYQAFFRLFPKLSGMTGTASTEAAELKDIYKLDVISIPTALPKARKDYSDVVFKTTQGKFRGVMKEIARVAPTGRPILIGTTSVEASENLSKLLDEVEVAHDVLNAKPKSAKREAEIIAQAGRKYSITIATNMAGRGTDILLGGNAAYFARALARRQLAALDDDVLNEIRDADNEGVVAGEGDGEGGDLSSGVLINDEDLPADVSEELMLDLKEAASQVATCYETNGKKLSTLATIDDIVAQAAEPSSSSLSETEVIEDNDDDESGMEFLRGVMAAIRDELEETVSEEREEVIDLGGLYVIGTERAESRRVDNQLRGRSGRQGDPGASRFFLGLDDNLFRVFGGDSVKGILERFRVGEDTPIENSVVSKALDNAQSGVEEYFRGIRDAVFTYDEVLSTQRAVFYTDRRRVLVATDEILWQRFENECLQTGMDIVDGCSGDFSMIAKKLSQFFDGIQTDEVENSVVKEVVKKRILSVTKMKKDELDGAKQGFANDVLRFLWLSQMDQMWQGHMKTMEYVKEMVGLRSYANEDPIQVFQTEGFEMFTRMNDDIRRNNVFSFFQYKYKTPSSSSGN